MPTLNSPIRITKTIKSFTIQSTNDSLGDRRVSASVRLTYSDDSSRVHDYVLWEGATYDQIGDWTQAGAETRVIELIS